MINQYPQDEIGKLLRWNKPELRVLTVSFDTAEVKSGSGVEFLDRE